MQSVCKVAWNRTNVKLVKKLEVGLCDWSNQNWVAFTTGYASKFEQAGQAQFSTLHSDLVFIIDPDTPWEVHSLKTGHHRPLEHLEWHPTEQMKLLTADGRGICKIWSAVDSCVNKWSVMHSIEIGQNDSIVKLMWLETGKKFYISSCQPTRINDMMSKFPAKQTNLFRAPHGGQRDAFICLTSSGVIYVVTIVSGKNPVVSTARLGNIRSHIFKADMQISDAGKVGVAAITNDNTIELFILSFRNADEGKVEIQVDVSPCIVPFTVSEESGNTDYKVTDARFILNNSSDQVLVVCDSGQGTTMQCFEVRKEQIVLHQRFKRAQPSQPSQSADACVCLRTVPLPAGAKLHAITRLQVNLQGSTNDNMILPKAVFVDLEGMCHIYSLKSWTNLSKSILGGANNSIKEIDFMMFSPCDQAVFCVSSEGDALICSIQHLDMVLEKTRVQSLVNLLQYSIIDDCVPWDVFLYMRTQNKQLNEQVLQVLSEEFNELHALQQEYHMTAYLSLKAMFYKTVQDFVGAFESFNIILLRSIYMFVTGMLTSEKDVIFMDSLQAALANSKETDINQICVMEVKETSLQSIADPTNGMFMQWIVDFASHLVRLVRAPDRGRPWKHILSYFERWSLLELRELLVIVNILVLKHPSVTSLHPTYVSMDNIQNILKELFKFISKLYYLSTGETSVELSQNDLLFSSIPLMYLPMPSHDTKGGLLSLPYSLPHQQQTLGIFEFQLQPDDWQIVKQMCLENPLHAGTNTVSSGPRQIYDALNLVPCSLMQGELLKQCCLCGTLTVAVGSKTRVFHQAWRGCWLKTCFCGGNWKEVKWQDV